MMKIILTFALLAFAVHASNVINTTDYCLGFAKGANFTDIQTQNCFKCLQSNSSIDYTLSSDFSLDPINPNATRDSLFHAVYPKDPVRAECQPHVSDLQAIYLANKTADELFNIITENSNKYFMNLMMDFAAWRVRLVENDGSKFGGEEARISGYVTGIMIPKESEFEGGDQKSPKLLKKFLAF